jgi:hypothetical protein
MVLVVTVYSLCETLLLLLSITPQYPYFDPRLYQWMIWWGQLLVIPGLAALFSRWLYGHARSGLRALTIVVVSGATVMVVIVLAFSEYLMSSSPLPESVALGISVLVFFAALCGIGIGLFFYFRNVVRRTFRIESRRWLAERQSGTDPSAIRWRNRCIRCALCIPSAVVLLVFLFLPEAWGMLSHVRNPRAGVLGGYRIPIPNTWIVLYHGEAAEQGEDYVRGLAGRGMGIDLQSYLAGDLPLSTWTIGIARPSRSHDSTYTRWTPNDSEIIGHRVFTIGDENVTCLEYWPAYLERPAHVEDSKRAFVECSGSQRLAASFVGKRTHMSAFYRMLEGAKAQ